MNSSIISNRSPWLAVSIAFLSMFFVGVPVSRGEIIHRYFFSEKSLEDLVGEQNGQGPPSDEFDEIKFSKDVPEKASGVSLDLSEVGEGKISGVTFAGAILNEEKGAYALWIKPTQDAEGKDNRFIVASSPLKDGMTLALRGRSRVLARAKGNNIGPLPIAPKSEWQHIALIWDATNAAAEGPRAELFINGESAGSAALEGSLKAKKVTCGISHLEYGVANSGQSYASTQYRGLIYDLQIYNESLTAGQVRKLYENPGLALGEIPGSAQRDSQQ